MSVFGKVCLALGLVMLLVISLLFWMIDIRRDDIANLQVLAEATDRLTPLSIDDVTRLDDVSAEGLGLVLNHTVTDWRITRDHYDRRIENWFKDSICQQEKIGSSVQVVYNFYREDKTLLASYRLKPSSCDG